MSGILGIFYFDGRPVDPEILNRMTDTLAHRGSDGADTWVNESVGLGHRMFWTTPESLLEKLPAQDLPRQLVITADARIDNRDDLINRLQLRDRPAEKITDSALILAAYQAWEEECPQYLIGDFAFAIWDAHKHQLFCGRDPFGIKPFYYHHSNQGFVFGSEIKALLCVPNVPRHLNELMVACYLDLFAEDEEITFYQDIVRLPAAHSLIIQASGNIKLQEYWTLDLQHQIQYKSQQEYAEAFRDIFVEAVRCRLRSAFPVGSTLSGGLDSSSITCIARQIKQTSGGQPLHTFSAIFPTVAESARQQIDERYYMDTVKALGGFTAHDIRADLLSPLTDYVWADDEPRLAFNMYIHQGMYECAQQNDVRVFLDGMDGDGVVSHGWGYLTDLTYTGQWLTLQREVTMLSERLGISARHIFWNYSVRPFIHNPLANFRSTVRRYWRGSERNWINPKFAQRLSFAHYIQQTLDQRSGVAFSSRKQHLQGLQGGLYPYAMENMDKATALASVEGRYPFFDRRLVEFSLAIPAAQKLNQGWPRAIHRYAMTDILPPEIQWRATKADLSPNFRQQMLEGSPRLLKSVIDHPHVIEPYVNMPIWQQAYEAHLASPLTSGQGIGIFGVSTLALWLQKQGFT